ncbi:NmrA family NAD(P)-binding protein [Nocardia sp. NPDC002869]|uniref:NmrA family NAD(P)-binding protein n=1 Tax=Nocardia sp. NPDC002869 TaxID=3161032 RepID=UPI00398C9BD6
MSSAIVVTGATGPVGRQVVAGLRAGGAGVRAVTRQPDASPAAAGVEFVSARTPFADLLDGARAALINVNALGAGEPTGDPGARLEELIAAARGRGVGHLVLLSSASAADPESPIGAGYRPLEDRLGRFDGAVTILRSVLFMSNTAHWWSAGIRQAQAVSAPYADVAVAPIDERDVAAVVTGALLSGPAAAAGEYLLTGPALLTPREMVATIADVLGIDIAFEDLPPETVRGRLVGAGLPARAVDGLLRSFEYARLAPVAPSPAVQRFTGRPAGTYAQWVADHPALFR